MKAITKNDYFRMPLWGYHEELTRLIVDKDIRHKKVLDIGSGFGWFEQYFVKKKPKSMVGIEPSDEAIKIARGIEDKRVKFYKGSALKLPFKKGSIDTAVCFEVLEHVPKGTEYKTFVEIKRVLKVGGILYLTTQNRSLISNLFDPAWLLIGHRHYRPSDVSSFAEKCDFSIKKVYTKGGFFTSINFLNLYISKWIFHRTPFFENFFRKMSSQEYKKNRGFVNIFLKCEKK